MVAANLFDILVDRKKRNQKYFLNYAEYGGKIKEIAKRILDNDSARVIIFGSVVKGTWIPNTSDIDILIVSEKVENRASWQSKIRTKILGELGDYFAPLEIQFATPETYRDWYSHFIKNDFIEV